MKKLLRLLAIILLLTDSATAQKWSAGFRTGLEQLEPRLSDKPFGNDNMLWNNQVFLNRKITRRLEGEINITHNRTSNTDSSRFFDGPSLVVENERINKITLGLNLRYYVLYGSRWSAFAQAGASVCKSWRNYDGVSYSDLNSTPTFFSGKGSTEIDFNTVSAGIGINYNLNKHFYLNSLFNVLYRPNGTYTYMSGPYTETNFSLALYAGIGFRF